MINNRETTKVIAVKKLSVNSSIWAVFTVSASLLVVGVFALSKWAELSALHHAVQHILIFTSGTGVGAALFWAHTEKRQT